MDRPSRTPEEITALKAELKAQADHEVRVQAVTAEAARQGFLTPHLAHKLVELGLITVRDDRAYGCVEVVEDLRRQVPESYGGKQPSTSPRPAGPARRSS